MKLQARRRPPGDGVFFAIRIIFGLMCSVFLCIAVKQLKQERRFETEGTITSGIVSSKRVEERNSIDRETKRPIVTRAHFWTLKFPANQGRDVEVEVTVDGERWQSAYPGEPVLVECLFRDPKTCREAGTSQKTGAWLTTGISGIGVLVGLWAIIGRFQKNRSDTPAIRAPQSLHS